MEFLRDKFNDELAVDVDDNGDIIIEGKRFSPSEILKELDSVSYDEVFIEWLERRKESMSKKADQILALYDNRRRFRSLQEAYKRTAVIPFVGAGMSAPSGYPGWTSFLWQLREETRIPEVTLKKFLDSGQYEEAAQALAEDMPAGSFDETLENTYGHDESIAGPIQLLPYIFSPCAITTNYDDVLKRCYESAEKPFREILIGADAPEIPRALGRRDDVLIKLHGKATSGNGRVLIFKEYQEHYGEDASLNGLIEHICNNTLLFLGCSLGVDRTLTAMRALLDRKGNEAAVRHYAFLPLKDDEDRLARRDELVKANIYPIWFPAEDERDDCIEALLRRLAEGVVEI